MIKHQFVYVYCSIKKVKLKFLAILSHLQILILALSTDDDPETIELIGFIWMSDFRSSPLLEILQDPLDYNYYLSCL